MKVFNIFLFLTRIEKKNMSYINNTRSLFKQIMTEQNYRPVYRYTEKIIFFKQYEMEHIVPWQAKLRPDFFIFLFTDPPNGIF